MIKINCEDITIRPSSIDTFYNCAYKWGKAHLEGVNTIPNSRAALGTGIHAGVEHMWNEAIESGKKAPNLSSMVDAAMSSWKEETHDGVSYDEGEDEKTIATEIIRGTEAFIEDVVEFTPIPTAVETRLSLDIDHVFVKRLSGTVDYIAPNTIADVKTSKRKPMVKNYMTQQSIYKFLAEANGYTADTMLIQGVVLRKTGAEGMVLTQPTDVQQAKGLVNSMLDTLTLVNKDIAPIETILRGNPKYYLCSDKYCSEYNTCPFVKGTI